MQPINQFLIFELGAKVRAVTVLPETPTLAQAAGPLFALRQALQDLGAGNPIQLDYSMGGIRDAWSSVSTTVSEYDDKEGKFDLSKDWNQKLSPWGLSLLKQNLARLEYLLPAEFEKTATYLVPKTTSFDTTTLIERAIETLTPEVRGELSDMATSDYLMAGRCLGFGLYTAAGFHVARATEAVMDSYCDLFLGADDGKSRHTWGQMLGLLEKCKKEVRPDRSTLVILEQIKNVDRNDLMHPRKTLDLTEATRLFYLATGAIIAMAMEMRSKAYKGRQGSLFKPEGEIVALAPPPAREVTNEPKKGIA